MLKEDKKSREAGEPEQLFYQDQVTIWETTYFVQGSCVNSPVF